MVESHSIFVFDQDVIETADGYKEQDDLYVVENVDPLLSLRALTTDVKHLEGQVAGIEDSLTDTCRPKACTQDVLVSGDVVLLKQSAEITHVAVDMSVSSSVVKKLGHVLFEIIVQGILVTFCNGTLHTIIVPQVLESVHAI